MLTKPLGQNKMMLLRILSLLRPCRGAAINCCPSGSSLVTTCYIILTINSIKIRPRLYQIRILSIHYLTPIWHLRYILAILIMLFQHWLPCLRSLVLLLLLLIQGPVERSLFVWHKGSKWLMNLIVIVGWRRHWKGFLILLLLKWSLVLSSLKRTFLRYILQIIIVLVSKINVTNFFASICCRMRDYIRWNQRLLHVLVL